MESHGGPGRAGFGSLVPLEEARRVLFDGLERHV